MCGRYSLAPEESGDIMRIVREIEAKFGPGSVATGEIRPTNAAPVLMAEGPSDLASRPVRWGFPGFQGKGVVINARGETAPDKPMFRRSLLERRCVVPSTGFYEWDKSKQKYLFRAPNSSTLYLAGLWNTFAGEERFVILTTAPNETVSDIHDRMPVLLAPHELDVWLHDPGMATAKLTARQMDVRRELVS